MATTTTSASVSASAEEFFRKDFFFRNRSGLLDWEKICQLDLQQIVSEVDVEQLQELIENITFADLIEDDLQYISPVNFIQLFRTSQLMLEYLVNSQTYILNREQKVTDENVLLRKQVKALSKKIKQKDEKLNQYRRKLTGWHSAIQALTVTKGKTGGQTINPAEVMECALCKFKASNRDKLIAHYQRRHPGCPLPWEKQPEKKTEPPASVVVENLLENWGNRILQKEAEMVFKMQEGFENLKQSQLEGGQKVTSAAGELRDEDDYEDRHPHEKTPHRREAGIMIDMVCLSVSVSLLSYRNIYTHFASILRYMYQNVCIFWVNVPLVDCDNVITLWYSLVLLLLRHMPYT